MFLCAAKFGPSLEKDVIDGKCDVRIIHTRSEISDACKKVLFLAATIVSAALISSVGRSFA